MGGEGSEEVFDKKKSHRNRNSGKLHIISLNFIALLSILFKQIEYFFFLYILDYI